MSSSSYPSPIVRARPRYLEEAREPSYRASSDPFAETSSPWQSRLSSPRVTVRNIPPAILHPLQPFPASFFITHGTSSPSSTSHRRSCSPQEFIFPPILLHNQGYPKVCPDSLNLPNAGNPFAGISSLSSCSLFSRTRDLIASI
jgi:hypothetical protein